MSDAIASVAHVYEVMLGQKLFDATVEKRSTRTSTTAFEEQRKAHEQRETLCRAIVQQVATEISDVLRPVTAAIMRAEAMPTPDELREIMRGIHERLMTQFGNKVPT